MRFSTAASGTSFTRTQIFKMLLLGLLAARGTGGRRMLPTPLTDESIGVGNEDREARP
jgi:hypothetical protein